jgi:hypothetical protein
MMTLRITKGHEAEQSFGGIQKSEHYVEIADGIPGLRRLKILVNGKLASTLNLESAGTAHADLSAAMDQEQNTLTFVGEGRPGSYANIDLSDSLPRKTKLPTAQEAGTWGHPVPEAVQ